LSDTVVLGGHDSVNRALLLQLLEQPLSAAQQSCTINEINIVGRKVRVLCINDTSHVRALA
jgi:hypothetical protein